VNVKMMERYSPEPIWHFSAVPGPRWRLAQPKCEKPGMAGPFRWMLRNVIWQPPVRYSVKIMQSHRTKGYYYEISPNPA
jgi:hypothetical protein